jgi:hypothetical protein
MSRVVSPDVMSLVSWDTEDGYWKGDAEDNFCDDTGRLHHAGCLEPVDPLHQDYVVGFNYVVDIDLRDFYGLKQYSIFNRYGMLRRPYAGNHWDGIPSFLTDTAEKVLKRPRWRPSDLELCLLSMRRKEDGAECLHASFPGSDRRLDPFIKYCCYTSTDLSDFSKKMFGAEGMIRDRGVTNQRRVQGVPSDLEICLRARADKEDREEYRSDAGVTRRTDLEMCLRGISR